MTSAPYITPGSRGGVYTDAAAGGDTPQSAFTAEYSSLGIKTNAIIPLTATGSPNNAGVKNVVGSNAPQSTQDPVSPTGNVQSSSNVGYDIGTGWWIGFDKGTPKLFIGNSAGNKITWDGDVLTITGDFVIGGISRTIDSSDDIQTAITAVAAGGGGTLYLKAGTWTVNTAITGASSVAIVGISPSQTIINFNSTAANLVYAGTGVYTTGTITVASGVNITGLGTSWLANVTAGQSLFLGTRWYLIAAVTGNTTLILAEAYGDNVTLPSTYRIATPVRDVYLANFTVKNSTGSAIAFTDARQITFSNVQMVSNNKGMVLTNTSEVNGDRLLAVASTSNGIELTNLGLSDFESTNSIGNGGSGFMFSNVKTVTFDPVSANANTGDGFNITTGADLSMLAQASGNGGQGFELVATNSNIVVKDGPITGNASDGVKLTATSDSCRFYSLNITGNGGYGINIAASSCDNNIILGNIFAGNSTAAANDSGTGTLIRSNIGLADN